MPRITKLPTISAKDKQANKSERFERHEVYLQMCVVLPVMRKVYKQFFQHNLMAICNHFARYISLTVISITSYVSVRGVHRPLLRKVLKDLKG